MADAEVAGAALAPGAGADRYFIPPTVSPEAAEQLKVMYDALANRPPQKELVTLADFDEFNDKMNEIAKPFNDMALESLGATAVMDRIGGVPVLRVKTPNCKANSGPIVYVHGGGWVAGTADALSGDAGLNAQAAGREVISVDYSLAPRANFDIITGQVLAVWKGLLDQGYTAAGMGLTGGSAGGNIVLAAALRMRDEGLPLPGAIVAVAPAADLTFCDDSLHTLADWDPSVDMPNLSSFANAYAGGEDLKHPYLSPVYGDYSKPFPPTLIQVGTRDVLLSAGVRTYQAIMSGGNEAVLDIYEGMPHAFPFILAFTPEGQVGYSRAAAFFDARLAER